MEIEVKDCFLPFLGYTDRASFDFSKLCGTLLGRWGSSASVFFSLCTLLGAMIVSWILSTNFLYYIVYYIYGE